VRLRAFELFLVTASFRFRIARRVTGRLSVVFEFFRVISSESFVVWSLFRLHRPLRRRFQMFFVIPYD
jgi:hypothetical protein